jgi:hypothetical protein
VAPLALHADDRREEAILAHRSKEYCEGQRHAGQCEHTKSRGYRRGQMPPARVERSDQQVREGDDSDEVKSDAIGAGSGRMKALLGEIFIDREQGVEGRQRPDGHVRPQPRIAPRTGEREHRHGHAAGH